MAITAVFYPGAVGRSLAEALSPHRHSFVSCLTGRSSGTQENARRADIRDAASLAEAAREAEIVISAVKPDAAPSVAEEVARALHGSRRSTPVRFLDVNSIAPSTAKSMADVVEGAGASFVDGALIGPAAPVSERTLLLLSGPHAPALAEAFRPAMAVEIISDEVGHASAVKMSMSLMTKAMVALFLEMACAAEKAHCLEETLQMMRRFYPGTMEFFERTLPTYPKHAERRIVEMHEAHGWMRALSQHGTMTAAAASVLQDITDAGLKATSGSFAELLHRVVAIDPLRTDEPASGPR